MAKTLTKQDYTLKKYVRATSAEEALKLDASTPVSECFLVSDKPVDSVSAIGFQWVYPET